MNSGGLAANVLWVALLAVVEGPGLAVHASPLGMVLVMVATQWDVGEVETVM